ncbi:MAG: hypothetical protein ACXV8H_09460, partial [Chthoniobacterales bacterium]
IVAATSIALHVRLALFVGALWRDETNSLNLATLPRFSEIRHFIDYDSFPALIFAVLRVWTTLFGAQNDDALRLLGLLIGLGVLAVLCFNACTFGSRLPLLSLALIGLNPMIIRYGDSIRAYGLGILLILLTLRAFWRLVETEAALSAKRIVIATLCALLSVHCLYYNSVLLLAIATGAIAAAARRRAWKTIAIILAIGALAAVSLSLYAPVIMRMQDWTFMVHYSGDFVWLWKRASEVMGSPLDAMVWVWAGLVVGSLLFAGLRALLGLVRQKQLADLPAPVLFAVVTMFVGMVGYACFLRALNYYTQPWYYVTLAAFVACNLDIVLGAWPQASNRNVTSFFQFARPLVALALLCVVARPAWREMKIRHTNADLVAARLEGISKEGDLILVPRWECAISFSRYYHGPSEVVTLPPIEDHRFHRYDLVLAQMKTQDAHLPVLAKMEGALHSGHRVYFINKMLLPDPAERLPVLHPLYRDENGVLHGSGYNAVWGLYAGQFLAAHAVNIGGISLNVPGYDEVQEYEDLELRAAEGWRD